jgi:hypothetical protein
MDEGYPLYRHDCNFAHQGLDGYQQFFVHCAGQPNIKIYLEATPDYMYQETALSVLAGLDPRPKVVFVLRHPAERVYSLYRFAQQNMAVLPPDVAFSEFLAQVEVADPTLARRPILLNAVNHSRYSQYLRRWIKAMGAEYVKVVVFEEMIRQPQRVLSDLCVLFGIEPGFYEDYTFSQRNASVAIQHHRLHFLRRRLSRALPSALKPKVLRRLYDSINLKPAPRGRSPEDQAVIVRLTAAFSAEIEALSSLTGEDFSSWSHTPDGVRIAAALR